MIIFLGLAGSLFTVQFHRDRLKTDYVNKISAAYSAEGAINYGLEQFWQGFVIACGGQPGSLGEFRAFLSKNSIVNLPEETWAMVPLTEFRPSEGATAMVQVYRTDGDDYTDLRFRSSVTLAGISQTVESTFRGEGKTFSGFNFALFSNNVSCTFCHAKIDNVRKYDGGPYERVRVATLESLMVRSGSANSTIAGTLYTMGKIMEKDGTVLSSLASSSVDGYSFKDYMVDPETTELVDLSPAPIGADGKPVAGGGVDWVDSTGKVNWGAVEPTGPKLDVVGSVHRVTITVASSGTATENESKLDINQDGDQLDSFETGSLVMRTTEGTDSNFLPGRLVLGVGGNGSTDIDGDNVADPLFQVVGETFTDANKSGIFDDGEAFIDANGNGRWDGALAVNLLVTTRDRDGQGHRFVYKASIKLTENP